MVAPSQATIYRDMFKAEMKEREKLEAPSAGTPVTICLDTALKIQSKQWVYICYAIYLHELIWKQTAIGFENRACDDR